VNGKWGLAVVNNDKAMEVRARSGWELLRTRSFGLLFSGQAVSQIGDSMNKVALLWFVYELTGSAFKMAVIGLLQTIPPLVFGPLIGVYLDRMKKKPVMVWVDLIRTGLVMLIPLLYAMGALTLEWLYVLVFATSIVSTVFGPALASAVPLLVPRAQLTAANALTVVSGRSIGIPPLNRASLNDLRNVRVEIETLAAIWAARNITDAEIADIEELHRKLSLANATGDVRSFLRANHAFHFAIYRAARSETLLTIIENLWLQISPYFNLLRGSGNYEVSNTHHQVMVDGLKARKEKQVSDAVRADIDAAYQVLLALVSP